MKGINKWLDVQKDWTFILLGLAIIGIIAFVCNLFLCKYVKRVRNNQTNMEMNVRWQEENNHGFDPRAIATSLIAMSNLGETQALEVNLAKHDQNNMNMHVAFKILDIVYLILMHVGIVIFLYVLH